MTVLGNAVSKMYFLNNFWILQRQTLQILFLVVLFYVMLDYVCHSLKSVQNWIFFFGPHFPSLKLNMKWYRHFSGSVFLRKRFNPFLSSVPILYPLVFSGGYKMGKVGQKWVTQTVFTYSKLTIEICSKLAVKIPASFWCLYC